jgi:predicted solute-binding protein
VGIASRGAVRSILLVSKCPAEAITTLAADTSSRTSAALARVWLAERHGVKPAVRREPPHLETMLARADAALIIGDPALRLDPAKLPYHVYDLGEEWTRMTGLPMVYAVWAGPQRFITREVARVFQESWEHGAARLEEIAEREAPPRGIPAELGARYLRQHVVCELGEAEMRGMERFLELASRLADAEAVADASVTI